jgi:hypothetical protein
MLDFHPKKMQSPVCGINLAVSKADNFAGADGKRIQLGARDGRAGSTMVMGLGLMPEIITLPSHSIIQRQLARSHPSLIIIPRPAAMAILGRRFP